MKSLSLITLTPGPMLWARLVAPAFVGMLAIAASAPGTFIHAQYCNPAVVSYIVRDEAGKVLDGAALKSILEQLPPSIREARVSVGEVSLSDNGKRFYWRESIDWAKGEKVPSLQFINNETCTMHLTEATLIYKNIKMRLVFNLEITSAELNRRPVVDSLSYQEGTFRLDLTGWSQDADKVIPSEMWKKVRDKPED